MQSITELSGHTDNSSLSETLQIHNSGQRTLMCVSMWHVTQLKRVK